MTPRWSTTIVGYLALLALTIAGFWLIRGYGESLVGLPAATSTVLARQTPHSATLYHALFALGAVIVVGQLLARVFTYLGQPPVIGEVVAGILLGPSLLGTEWSAKIMPPDTAPFLAVIAQLGVILYMFLVGLELNADRLRDRAHAFVAISHASILVPFLLGSALALVLYPRLSSDSVSFTNFALFMGVAMSITAFPVLARILTDRNLSRTELGVIALSCAATDDITAWCLLALVVGVVQSQVDHALSVAGGAVAYLAVMLLFVRPWVRWFAHRPASTELSRGTMATVLVALLASALATERIGIHALFGAFFLGALIPHESSLAKGFQQQLERVTTVLLMPAFFALTGMRTRIDLLSGIDQWLICAAIIFVATLGKFGGTIVAARLTGLNWRHSAALGTLMNTRGLMELIVLNIGLDLGVISPALFAMMVLMALVTTMITSPVLRLLLGDTELAQHS